MYRASFKQTIDTLQEQIGDIYCKLREARGMLDILGERWGYNDPNIDVQYAYLGVQSVLQLGENLADTLERDITALRNSVAPLLAEDPDFYDWDGDDEQTSEWYDDAQMDLAFQDEEGTGPTLTILTEEEFSWPDTDGITFSK